MKNYQQNVEECRFSQDCRRIKDMHRHWYTSITIIKKKTSKLIRDSLPPFALQSATPPLQLDHGDDPFIEKTTWLQAERGLTTGNRIDLRVTSMNVN
ncbi:hypothetical protein E2C01_032624 [Portunus trituberculatus]|uniref:Uncharacterized protein n=1 Tax=Portunus trituberculatus TaxID=210409 RepID=A0A5B7F3B0_PORTR|nr:hypothetical protein [Portunus trituberculatus]